MKRTRIFFAATLALAIVGAVAVNANTKSVTYFYKDPNNGNACTPQSFDTDPCTGGSINCTADFGLGTLQLYTASNCAIGTEAKRP